MTAFYSAFGLRLSSSLPIPGLAAPSPCAPGVDVQVCFGWVPSWLRELRGARETCYASGHPAEGNVPALVVERFHEGGYYRFHYEDGTEFILDRSGSRVWATWPAPLTVEDTATYLLGPVLGFVLRLRGTVCLHASAVAVGGRAVALLGPAGAGKSTTAAAFARWGYPVLSDDVVALQDGGSVFRVQPATPTVRLWPASVAALFGAPDALPLLTPNWDKRYLDVQENGYRFQQQPLPLAAVYVLGERRRDRDAPFVSAVSPQTGLMALVANAYTSYLLDQAMRAREFNLLGRLAARVPLRQVTPHASPEDLPNLCRVILNDVADMAGPGPHEE
jgi:hypothetical protein